MQDAHPRRSRTTASTSTARSTSRARCARSSTTRPSAPDARRLVDHAAARQAHARAAGHHARSRCEAATEPSIARKIRELKLAIAVRGGRTPRRRSSSATSTSPTSATAPTASTPRPTTTSRSAPTSSTSQQAATLAGLVKNPSSSTRGVYPGARAAAPQHGARRDGAATARSAEREAETLSGRAARPQDHRRSPTAASRPKAAFSLRLRPSLPARRSRPSAPPSRTAGPVLERGGLTIKSTIDLRDAEGDQQGGHVDRRAQRTGRSASIALVEPGTGKVRGVAQSRPMGRDKKAGESYINFAVPAALRRLRRLPGRVDVQDVHGRRGPEEGHPGHQDLQRAARRMTMPGRHLLRLQRRRHRHLEGRQLHASRQHEHVHRPAPVREHLLRPARAGRRPVQHGQGRRVDGHRGALRSREAHHRPGRPVHARRHVGQPARRWPRPTPLRPAGGMYCEPQPVDRDRRHGRQGRSRSTRRSASGS